MPRSAGRGGIPQERRELVTERNIPLWEVFIRSRNGLAHKHVGSLHASDSEMALQAARDVYTRRGEGLSIWVVPSAAIVASDPSSVLTTSAWPCAARPVSVPASTLIPLST